MKHVCTVCGALVQQEKLDGTLRLMRHGRTGMNNRHLIIGSINDGLTAGGQRQVTQARLRLLASPTKPTRVVTSPLLRARASADSIARFLAVPVIVDGRLRERYVGIHEGKPEFPGMLNLFLSHRQIKNAEPFEDFECRIGDIFSETLAEHHGEDSLLVTHALPLLLMMKLVKRWTLRRTIAYRIPENSEIVSFRIGHPCERCGSEFAEVKTN